MILICISKLASALWALPHRLLPLSFLNYYLNDVSRLLTDFGVISKLLAKPFTSDVLMAAYYDVCARHMDPNKSLYDYCSAYPTISYPSEAKAERAFSKSFFLVKI